MAERTDPRLALLERQVGSLKKLIGGLFAALGRDRAADVVAAHSGQYSRRRVRGT